MRIDRRGWKRVTCFKRVKSCKGREANNSITQDVLDQNKIPTAAGKKTLALNRNHKSSINKKPSLDKQDMSKKIPYVLMLMCLLTIGSIAWYVYSLDSFRASRNTRVVTPLINHTTVMERSK